MVLSNKKLIREDLVNSVSDLVAEINLDSIPNLQSQSLKELIDSASHKPRLSSDKTDKKDGKKRKIDELGEPEGDESGKEGKQSQKKKEKKRKAKNTTKKAEEDNVEDKVKVEEEIQVDTESKEEDGVIPNKLYVGGIPYQSTEDEIRSYFRSCGIITEVDCKMRPEDGTFSGIAFITFQTEDGANRALAFDRAAMGDQFLTIQQYVKSTPSIPRIRISPGLAPEMVDGYNRAYIGNLAWDTTEHDIRKVSSECVINSVRLDKNKETEEFKGYAHEVNDGNYFTATVSSGKMRRRVCYECREKGHLSKACPKKLQNTVQQNSKVDHLEIGSMQLRSYNHQYKAGDIETNGDSYMDETYGANDGSLASAVSVGKIERRKCDECGEKDHLSTVCSKKQQNSADLNIVTEYLQFRSLR